jgi:hypothetical protein
MDRLLLHRSRRRRSEGFDVRLESRSIGFTVDDEIEGAALEVVDGTLGEQSIVEGGDPFGYVAIAGLVTTVENRAFLSTKSW